MTAASIVRGRRMAPGNCLRSKRATPCPPRHPIPPATTSSPYAWGTCVQIHPVDLTKTQMQVIGKVDGVRPSPLAVAKRVVAENGIKGLYAGLSAALLRQAVYGTARLGLHRTFSNQLKGDNPTLSLGGKVAASMVRRGGMRWM